MSNRKNQKGVFEKVEGVKVSYREFYAIHAAMEGWSHVPSFHWDLVEFLENEAQWTNRDAVIQAFRGASKSSLTATWIAWKLAGDPTLLFLIQSADDNLAMKMNTDVSKIVRSHPFCEHLVSKTSKWTERGFSVRGATSGRNWSVSARGVGSNVTGLRCNYLVLDDVEVPNTSRSEKLREDLRARISESSKLLLPNGARVYIGTPHATDSIYPEQIDKGASTFRVPFLKDIEGEWPFCSGTCSWPERWNDEQIKRIQQACTGKAEFYSQYQLIPMLAEDSYLDPAFIRTYNCEPEFIESNGSRLYRIDGKKITAHCAFWDPALSKVGRDSSVLAIVFCTQAGDIYIHRTVAVQGDIDRQCEDVRKLLVEFCVPTCYVETNGLGAWTPGLLIKHTSGLGIAIDGRHTSTKKSESIQTAYETPLSAGILHVHENVMETKFLSQLRDFNPRFMKGGDDFIDAPAKAIHLLPVQIDRASLEHPGFEPYRMYGTEVEIAVDYV